MPNQILFQKKSRQANGLTLFELIIAIAVIGVLAGMGIPGYLNYRKNANITKAVNQIMAIEFEIDEYYENYKEYPDSLSDIGQDQLLDPWGNPYRYLRINGGKTIDLNGKRRRDKNANPVNSDYDLYSMGEDGLTSAQFMAKKARDDVVRANDGKYYGLAEKH